MLRCFQSAKRSAPILAHERARVANALSSVRIRPFSHGLLAVWMALAGAAALEMPSAAHAQARPVPLPPVSLRGELTFGQPPQVQLNDKATTLSPAARIRNAANTLVMSASLMGQTLPVNYTLDARTGQVLDVWLLNAAEAGRRWPTTLQEAGQWVYDPYTQSWRKP